MERNISPLVRDHPLSTHISIPQEVVVVVEIAVVVEVVVVVEAVVAVAVVVSPFRLNQISLPNLSQTPHKICRVRVALDGQMLVKCLIDSIFENLYNI